MDWLAKQRYGHGSGRGRPFSTSVPILTLPLHVLPADEHEEETFASQDGAGASLTFPQQVSLPPVFFPPRAFM